MDNKDKNIVEIPKQYLELLEEENKQQGKLIDNMLNVSMKVIGLEDELEKEKITQKKIRNLIVNSGQRTKKIVGNAHKHLGLDKQPQYVWGFTGKTFIGTPKSPEQKEK